MCWCLPVAPLLPVLYLGASCSWCLMGRPLWQAQKKAMTSGSSKIGFHSCAVNFLLPSRCHNLPCSLDTFFQLVFSNLPTIHWLYLRMSVLKILRYWEFPCGITRVLLFKISSQRTVLESLFIHPIYTQIPAINCYLDHATKRLCDLPCSVGEEKGEFVP